MLVESSFSAGIREGHEVSSLFLQFPVVGHFAGRGDKLIQILRKVCNSNRRRAWFVVVRVIAHLSWRGLSECITVKN